jgi:hypothetical protein
VRVVDGKVSVQVKEIPLVQLVKLLDEAMGTKSRVKKELETKKMTVRFDDLPYDAAVKKIFQAAQLDYIVLPEGLIVTAPSTTTAGGTSASTTVQPTLPQPTLPNPTVPGLEQSPFGPQGNPPAVPPGALGAENPFTGSPNVGIAPPSSTATPGAPPIAPGGPASGPQPIITAPDFGGATMQGFPTFGGGAPAGGGGQGLGGGGLIPFGQPINP